MGNSFQRHFFLRLSAPTNTTHVKFKNADTTLVKKGDPHQQMIHHSTWA
jgi:hypothetical protein